MPALDETQHLQAFAEEIFDLSKAVWTAQSRAKSREQSQEISEMEFLALDLLAKSQPLTVGDIQRSIGVLPAQMSRVIRSLESKGDEPLITCTINPQDKRKIDVELTPAGARAHEAYRRMKLGSIERMLSGLSDRDCQEFMRILRTIRDSIRKSLNDK